MIAKLINNRFQLKEKLFDGRTSNLWLAYDVRDRNDVAVKILKRKTNTRHIEDVIRYKNIVLNVSTINHPNIVKIIELGEIDDHQSLVMEFIYGKNLQKIIQENSVENLSPFSTETTIKTIVQIASAMDFFHSKGIIHRDIKPGNIMAEGFENRNLEKCTIKIIDFGLSDIRGIIEFSDSKDIVGTFGYMSPEQLGVTSFDTDERSDLYSLGVIFYELITGKKPFLGSDIHSLIHQQIAKIPEAPSAFRELPDIYDRIINKLLEKEPTKRYQSAKGLLYDLNKLQNDEFSFVPGMKDRVVRLDFHTGFIGRKNEVNLLENELEKALEGNGSMCLISGEAGTGKTRLAEEMREILYSRKRLFLAVKCFPGENKKPYEPFKDILTQYLKHFSKKSNVEKTSRIGYLNNINKGFSEIIVQLNPQMKEIIKNTTPLVQLEKEREEDRYITAVSHFILSLSKAEEGLVLFFDDIQWSDNGTMAILKNILENISNYPLLLIATHRDKVPKTEEENNNLFKSPTQKPYPLTKIQLKPFDLTLIKEFIKEVLHVDTDRTADEIARYVSQASSGNMFFAIRIINQLLDEKALIADQNNTYHIDHSILKQINIPSSVLEIVMNRISLLSTKENEILSYASIIGKKFNIDFLFSLHKKSYSKSEIVNIVDKAISLHLLKYDLNDKRMLYFSHDRIQEAFYTRNDEKTRKALHLHIGATLEEIYDIELEHSVKECPALFDLANHFINGGQIEKAFYYSYPAGVKARENYANNEALSYLLKSLEYLEQLKPGENSEGIKINILLAEIYLTRGNYDEAINRCNTVLSETINIEKKISVYKLICQTYFKKGDWENCETFGKIGLKLLDENLPVKKLPLFLSIGKELFLRLLYWILPAIFILKKENNQSDKEKAIIWFYYNLGWSYVFSDQLKFFRAILRMVNISESKIGKSNELAMSWAGVGSVLMSIPFFNWANRYFQKALDLQKEIKDEWGFAQTLQFLGVFHQWKADYQKGIEYFDESIRRLEEMGDFMEIGVVQNNLILNHLLLSNYDAAESITYSFLEFSQKSNDMYGICTNLNTLASVIFEKGDYENAKKYYLESITLAKKNNIWFMYCASSLEYSEVLLANGEVNSALEHILIAEELFNKHTFMKQYIIKIYHVMAEILIAKYKNENHQLNNAERRKQLRQIKKYCNQSLSQTKRWKTYHTGALRANAKYYALLDKPTTVNKLYKQAIEFAKSISRDYALALSYFDYAMFFKQQKSDDKAAEYFLKSYDTFRKIGANGNAARVRQYCHVSGKEQTESLGMLLENLKLNKRITSLEQLSKDIVSNLSLQIVLERAVSTLVEITIAERGYIILNDKNDLRVAASKIMNEENLERYSENIIRKVLQHQKPVITTNAAEDNDYSEFRSVQINELKSILCIPVKSENSVLGVCYLDNSLSSGVFDTSDIKNIESLVNFIAFVLLNAHKKQENKDKNKVLSQQFFEEYNISKREKEIILLMIDGKKRQEISAALNVSNHTIKNHISNIYHKANVRNRIELFNLIYSSNEEE
ncbi:protein kinase [bacterium]|nr:protein kinase [bacterium]